MSFVEPSLPNSVRLDLDGIAPRCGLDDFDNESPRLRVLDLTKCPQKAEALSVFEACFHLPLPELKTSQVWCAAAFTYVTSYWTHSRTASSFVQADRNIRERGVPSWRAPDREWV
jgi:hypothetical protein